MNKETVDIEVEMIQSMDINVLRSYALNHWLAVRRLQDELEKTREYHLAAQSHVDALLSVVETKHRVLTSYKETKYGDLNFVYMRDDDICKVFAEADRLTVELARAKETISGLRSAQEGMRATYNEEYRKHDELELLAISDRSLLSKWLEFHNSLLNQGDAGASAELERDTLATLNDCENK